MNVSTAVNMFIKAVLREQKLPFEIKSNIFEETIYNKLKESEIEMNNTNKRYTIDEKEHIISIVRVLYSKMDISNILV